MENLKLLPTQKQDFESTIKGGFLYIDKTDYVYNITHEGDRKLFFLGRPRRFGKSLFMSTVQCYFEGKKELFEGLKITDLEQEWRKYEVLKFDFSVATEDEFRSKLDDDFSKYEEKYGIKKAPDSLFGSRLGNIILAASKGEKNSVVILIDEYDAPLGSNAFDKDKSESISAIYRNIFPRIKEMEGYIRFFFLTGVMKFTRMSIFSTFNNIRILGAEPAYASACGFTHDELKGALLPYVERMATRNRMSVNGMIKKLVDRYDSYCFSRDTKQKVFNPYGLINCLADCELRNYWNESGKAKVLFDSIEKVNYEISDWNNIYISELALIGGDFNPESLKLSLYQTGYLTIEKYMNDMGYKLRIPNKEVREALSESIIPKLVGQDEVATTTAFTRFRHMLNKGNMDDAMKELKALTAANPYSNETTQISREDRFQCALYYIFMGCEYAVQREVEMCDGRLDLLAMNNKNVFVIEAKTTRNGGVEEAVKQIRERGYAEPYKTDRRRVYCLAVEFDTDRRMMAGWKWWEAK